MVQCVCVRSGSWSDSAIYLFIYFFFEYFLTSTSEKETKEKLREVGGRASGRERGRERERERERVFMQWTRYAQSTTSRRTVVSFSALRRRRWVCRTFFRCCANVDKQCWFVDVRVWPTNVQSCQIAPQKAATGGTDSAAKLEGEGRRRINTFSILIHWKSQTSLKLNCESTNIISSTLPRLRRCLATNSANLSQNIILVTIHWTTCGSSRGPTSATLSPTPGTLRACLQTTEARAERLRPTLHGKTIGSTIKTSRKEKKTCQRQRSERLVFLLVSLSTRPRQNSSLLPFHETHAWSAAVFHALYHYSDETGPYKLSKKGFWGIWQAYFGSLWHASRRWQRGQAIQKFKRLPGIWPRSPFFQAAGPAMCLADVHLLSWSGRTSGVIVHLAPGASRWALGYVQSNFWHTHTLGTRTAETKRKRKNQSSKKEGRKNNNKREEVRPNSPN